jgi:hypothetical protein
MEADFEYYLVMIIFGGVGILFFVYPFSGYIKPFKINGTTLLYWGVGAFFATLALAMLFQNGVLVEIMLALLFGSMLVWMGLSEVIGVITHNIPTDAVLTDIQKRRSRRGSHYELTFRIPGQKSLYQIDYVSSAKKFHVGENYTIYIAKKGNKAFIHRPWWFIFGVFVTLFGLLMYSLIFALL